MGYHYIKIISQAAINNLSQTYLFFKFTTAAYDKFKNINYINYIRNSNYIILGIRFAQVTTTYCINLSKPDTQSYYYNFKKLHTKHIIKI